jgi:hypothetical protein
VGATLSDIPGAVSRERWSLLAVCAAAVGVVGPLAGVLAAVESNGAASGTLLSSVTWSQISDPPTRDPGSAAVTEFQKRVEDYVALHKKIEARLEKLPQDAGPEQIDDALVQLSQGIIRARAGAKTGDVFIPAMQERIRQTLKQVFTEGDGKDLRASILDENPIGAPVRVNGPYPDSIPLTTMPPKVIAALPKLPDELEFRFIGDRLILFDHHAHLIVDYVDRALPMV